jgi:regulator of sigma E protease
MQRLNAAGVGETEYGLRLLPLGGFVRMKGQEDLRPIEDGGAADTDSYPACAVWKRMVVVSAGVVMNLLLAIALYVIAFMAGVRFESPTVGALVPEGPAAVARSIDGGAPGLRVGDRIERVDGAPTNTFADVQIAAAMSKPGDDVLLDVRRPGVEGTLRFRATPTDDLDARLRSLGLAPAHATEIPANLSEDPLLAGLLEPSGLAAAGVGPGWSLSGVSGAPVPTADALRTAMLASGGRAVETAWTGPASQTRTLALLPVPVLPRVAPDDAPNQTERALLGLSPLPRISAVLPDSLNAGVLRAGDVVLAVDDLRGPRTDQFRALVRGRPSAALELQVLRAGVVTPVRAQVDAAGQLKVLLGEALELPLLARTIDRTRGESAPTPAQALELAPLARIESVAGEPVRDWRELLIALKSRAEGATGVELVVRAWNASDTARVALPIDDAARRSIAAAAWDSPVPIDVFDPLMTTLGAPGRPFEAAALGFHETTKLALLTWLTLDRLARGSVPVDQLRGPVGIVHVGTRVADRGFTYLVFFLAMISVNLAVLNFLPLPIVDGGLFLYLVYEALRGRPPSERFQNAATMAGLLLIGGLFVVTFYNDVMRLVG